MLEFPVGSNANDTQCLSISILDDNLIEADNKTFIVELTVVTHPRVMEGNTETTIYIFDDDCKYTDIM